MGKFSEAPCRPLRNGGNTPPSVASGAGVLWSPMGLIFSAAYAGNLLFFMLWFVTLLVLGCAAQGCSPGHGLVRLSTVLALVGSVERRVPAALRGWLSAPVWIVRGCHQLRIARGWLWVVRCSRGSGSHAVGVGRGSRVAVGWLAPGSGRPGAPGSTTDLMRQDCWGRGHRARQQGRTAPCGTWARS